MKEWLLIPASARAPGSWLGLSLASAPPQEIKQSEKQKTPYLASAGAASLPPPHLLSPIFEETWSHGCDVTMAMTAAGHLDPFRSKEALMPQIIKLCSHSWLPRQLSPAFLWEYIICSSSHRQAASLLLRKSPVSLRFCILSGTEVGYFCSSRVTPVSMVWLIKGVCRRKIQHLTFNRAGFFLQQWERSFSVQFCKFGQ